MSVAVAWVGEDKDGGDDNGTKLAVDDTSGVGRVIPVVMPLLPPSLSLHSALVLISVAAATAVAVALTQVECAESAGMLILVGLLGRE